MNHRNFGNRQPTFPKPVMHEMQTQFGHNGEAVTVRFSEPITMIGLPPEKVDEWISHLEGAKAALLKHQAEK